MALAVQFDDEPGLRAIEVGDEGADGMLAAKLEPHESTVSQLPPEPRLGGGLILAELAGSISQQAIPLHGRATHPSPRPSPRRGEGGRFRIRPFPGISYTGHPMIDGRR